MGIAEPAQHRADIMRRLRELEQAVQQLQTGRRLGQTAFQAPGKVRYLDRDGKERIWIGERPATGEIILGYRSGPDAAHSGEVVLGTIHHQDTNEVMGHGLVVQRDTSNDVLQAWSLGQSTNVTLYDGRGNRYVWVNEDGLGLPRMPVNWAAGQSGDTVSDGDPLRGVAEGYPISTYPAMRLVYRVSNVTGTPDVQVRIRDVSDDVVLDDFRAFATGSATYETVDLDLSSWGHLARHLVRVEAEITSGTGTARVAVLGSWVGSFPAL